MAYGSTVLGESYACTGIDVDYRRMQFPEFNRQDGTHFGALSDYVGSEYILLFPRRRIDLLRRGMWRHSIEELANISNVPFDVVEQTYLDTPDDPHADEFLALLHSRAQYHSEPTENTMCMGIKNAILDFLR